MEKAELLLQIHERIQKFESEKPKDKEVTKLTQRLKRASEFLRKYKTDEHLISLFQKEYLSDGKESNDEGKGQQQKECRVNPSTADGCGTIKR